MTDLVPGTQAAMTALAGVNAARRRAILVGMWDEAAIVALNAAAPVNGIIASARQLSAAVWVAGELAQTVQTLGYLGRAMRNLTP